MKKHFSVLLAIVCLTGNITTLFAQITEKPAAFSVDIKGGMPIILTSARPSPSPFGGVALRYSLNKYFSLSLDLEGGGITGVSDQFPIGYFRTSFINGALRGNLNITPLMNLPYLKRYNFYVGAGYGYGTYLYDQTGSANGNTYERYTSFTWQLSSRYYFNEFVDFLGGIQCYYTPTTGIDNLRNNNRSDQFIVPYIGIGVKFLPKERVQHTEWSRIPLEYNQGSTTAQAVNKLNNDIREIEKKGNDSLAIVLRKEIRNVDEKVNKVNTKVDSVDIKLNMILALLSPTGTVTNTSTPDTSQKAKQPTGTKETGTTPKPDPKAKGPNGKTDIKSQVIDQKKVKEAYAIVVGSFLQDANALNARDRYIEKGWDAHILGNTGSQYKRIVIFSNNYYEAVKIVTELRKSEQPDVWMLDINTGKGVFIK